MAPISNRISPVASDLRMDEFLSIHTEKWAAFESLLPRLLEGEARKRKRRSDDANRLVRLARMVVANALVADVRSKTRKVYYSRTTAAYSNELKGIYYPEFVGTRALRKLIGAMASGGWLENTIGQWRAEDSDGVRSTFAATTKLLDACRELSISHQTTQMLPSAPVLILKNADKRRVPYPLRTKLDLILSLRAFNRFLDSHALALDITDDEWSQLLDEMANGNKAGELDLTRTNLHRVFNNSDWEQGGRFYGGWWQSLRSYWRHRILIDGEKTTELDYSGFIGRAAYHAEGLDFDSDPYDIPAVREMLGDKAEWPLAREGVKLAMHGLLNCKRQHDVSKITGLSFPRPIDNREAVRVIREHHYPIARSFKNGSGLRIMFRESRICQSILSASVEQRISILPIHDSYIVQGRHKEWLRQQMESSYRNEFGRDPVIRESDKREPVSSRTNSCGRTLIDGPLLPSSQVNPSYGETIRGRDSTSDRSRADTIPIFIPSEPNSDSGTLTQADARFQALLAALERRRSQ
jgi:hypothetical protein